MGGRNFIFLLIAIGVGAVAVLLANSYFSGMEQRQERIAQEQKLARIVVATQPLEFGAALTAQNLRLQNFPENSVPQGAFRSVEDATKGGRVALRPIVPGEPVLADKVSGSGGRAVLAANLPEGMRAASISVSAVTGVSGFVRPGDIVDVILTRRIPGGTDAQDMMNDVILEKIKVLAVDQVASEQATDPAVGKTAVLEVDLLGAQKLALAERIGQLSLALRNVESQDPEALTTVTARDLGTMGAYSAARPRRAQTAPMRSPPLLVYRDEEPASKPARQHGPTMTVYRGVEPTEETVGHLGGS